MEQTGVSLLVMDEYEIFRVGLCSALAQSPAIGDIHQAATPNECLEKHTTVQPDIVVVVMNGIVDHLIYFIKSLRHLDKSVRLLLLGFTFYVFREARALQPISGVRHFLSSPSRPLR